jgi:ArsR family transcriptional regulator
MEQDKDNPTLERQASLFAALADPTRLRLLGLLARQQEGRALCVNALAWRLGVTQSAVSQHLRVLKNVGLVRGERRGYRVHYFIDPEGLARCRDLADRVLRPPKPNEGKGGQESEG